MKILKAISYIFNSLKNVLFTLISYVPTLIVLIGILVVVVFFFKTAYIYLSTATYTP